MEAFNSTVIRYLIIDTESTSDGWIVNLQVYLAQNRKGSVNGNILVDLDLDFVNLTEIHPVSMQQNSSEEIILSYQVTFPMVIISKLY